jgi:hypothetical protein
VAATASLVLLVMQLRLRGLAIFVGAGVAALGLAAVALLPRLELVSRSTAANGVIDPAGYGTFAWADTRVLFGWFGPHTAELAPLYAGALTPALALFALVRHWRAARVPLALAVLALAWAAGLAGRLQIRSIRSARSPSTSRCAHCRSSDRACGHGGHRLRPTGCRPRRGVVAGLAIAIALLIEPDVLVRGPT